MPEFNLRPYCKVCGWRKGGLDSWDGYSCKCGLTEAPIELVGDNRVAADRMWRDRKRHVVFQRVTGHSNDRTTEEYQRDFCLWALGRIDRETNSDE